MSGCVRDPSVIYSLYIIFFLYSCCPFLPKCLHFLLLNAFVLLLLLLLVFFLFFLNLLHFISVSESQCSCLILNYFFFCKTNIKLHKNYDKYNELREIPRIQRHINAYAFSLASLISFTIFVCSSSFFLCSLSFDALVNALVWNVYT